MVIVIVLSPKHEAEVTKVKTKPRYARRIGTLGGVPVFYTQDSRDHKVTSPYLAAMSSLARFMFVNKIPQAEWSRYTPDRKTKPDEAKARMKRMF